MTVIVNEVFRVCGKNYITLNMSENEKMYHIWKYFHQLSLKKRKSALSMLLTFQTEVIIEYAIYLFGDNFIDCPVVYEELKQAVHGEIVKKLMVTSITNQDAIPNIELCLTLLREIQDTQNINAILYYLTKPKQSVVFVNE
jgi:hypothetical protein